jgi:hypothetical protein
MRDKHESRIVKEHRSISLDYANVREDYAPNSPFRRAVPAFGIAAPPEAKHHPHLPVITESGYRIGFGSEDVTRKSFRIFDLHRPAFSEGYRL